jgi:hypothetical protein
MLSISVPSRSKRKPWTLDTVSDALLQARFDEGVEVAVEHLLYLSTVLYEHLAV